VTIQKLFAIILGKSHQTLETTKSEKQKNKKKNTAIYTDAFFLALVFGAPFSFSLLILFLFWLKIVALALVGFWAVRELVAHARQLLSISVTFVRLPQA